GIIPAPLLLTNNRGVNVLKRQIRITGANKHRMGEDHPRIISVALWAEAPVYHVCKLLKQQQP
ncbi:hypothetical protein, partial [Jeotgalibaca porci]|uniref:hypothetical protein n=1 Tax=Jeotgalibaca porci TaxID=1868793 RepID=UPI0035A1018D